MFFKKSKRKQIEKLFEGFELPSFPSLVLEALRILRDPDAPLCKTAELVERDPGMSARILSRINSAGYDLRYPVANVPHAVSLLGRNQLESLLITLAVRDALPGGSVGGFDASRFWNTSARRAVAARALAERIEPTTAGESFTAALLQDMAVPLLAHEQDGYGDVLQAWHDGEGCLAELEREAFGWDHAEVASWLGEQWDLPELLVAAIASHHAAPDPDGEEDAPALPAVALVAALREENVELGQERLVAAAEDRCGIPADATLALLEASVEESRELARMFG